MPGSVGRDGSQSSGQPGRWESSRPCSALPSQRRRPAAQREAVSDRGVLKPRGGVKDFARGRARPPDRLRSPSRAGRDTSKRIEIEERDPARSFNFLAADHRRVTEHGRWRIRRRHRLSRLQDATITHCLPLSRRSVNARDSSSNQTDASLHTQHQARPRASRLARPCASPSSSPSRCSPASDKSRVVLTLRRPEDPLVESSRAEA